MIKIAYTAAPAGRWWTVRLVFENQLEQFVAPATAVQSCLVRLRPGAESCLVVVNYCTSYSGVCSETRSRELHAATELPNCDKVAKVCTCCAASSRCATVLLVRNASSCTRRGQQSNIGELDRITANRSIRCMSATRAFSTGQRIVSVACKCATR